MSSSAKRIAERLKAASIVQVRNGFEVYRDGKLLGEALTRRGAEALAAATPAAARSKPKKLWRIFRGDGSGYATQKLYTEADAHKLVKRAERMGIDVYATR